VVRSDGAGKVASGSSMNGGVAEIAAAAIGVVEAQR
jgi:hypothetical protein